MVYKVFEKHAERYDSWYRRHPLLFECEARTIRALRLKGRGLSVGVGTGILDSQARVQIGVDPSMNMVKRVIEYGIEPVRAVGEHLPFKGQVFDFALITVTLCFLDSPKKAFLDVRRVLRSGGEIAVCIVPKDSVWGKTYMEKARAGNIFYRHAHFYSLSELESMLLECFFKVVDTKASLSYSPSEPPRVEEPAEEEGKGFVCLKAVKTIKISGIKQYG
jgi:ubiquinone/menaquinone biosynthesis C-methylase UbiE